MAETMSWRDPILREFLPQVAPLTLVADPDCLLTEERIFQTLQEHGYEVLVFQDPVEFRFVYESQYRDRLCQSDPVYLIVVLQSASPILNLPYDLLKAGRRLSFGLANLFPLSYAVVKLLDLNCLDRLYQKIQRSNERLGENSTKNFILQSVFDVALDTIQSEVDLLRLLLQRHYRNQQLPTILDEYLIQQLRRRSQFQHIPLEKILSNRQAFFEFLQSQWLNFVQKRIPQAKATAELAAKYSTSRIDLSFDHEDIRVYINNLFLEGHLNPIAAHDLNLSSTDIQPVFLITSGISVNPQVEQEQRLDQLIRHLNDALPPPEANHQTWLSFAPRWAALIVLRSQVSASVQPKHQQPFTQLQQRVDTAFLNWVQLRYGGLFNQASTVMLHHIPRLMAGQLESKTAQKVALLVLDGMAFDQWLILRDGVQKASPNLQLDESAVFAWLPTITSVSRQALFSAKCPSSFPNSIGSTHKEEALWQQFWVEQGISKTAVAYTKALGEGSLSRVEEIIAQSKLRVLGLIVNSIDDRMHHAMDGTVGFHQQVAYWAESSFIQDTIKLLLKQNFTIFLTSDHGNVEAIGIGSPSERAIADLRGERVRVYNNEVLKQQVKENFSNVLDWTPNGLPKSYLPLFAPGRTAFVSRGEKIVGHGGISMEELIVPLIQIQRSNS